MPLTGYRILNAKQLRPANTLLPISHSCACVLAAELTQAKLSVQTGSAGICSGLNQEIALPSLPRAKSADQRHTPA